MLRRVFFMILMVGSAAIALADHSTLFKVRIENVSNAAALKSSTGATAPAALSPGLYVVSSSNSKDLLFTPGKPDAGMGLEAQAEDGSPDTLAASVRKKKGVMRVEVFNTPAGMDKPGPILPGGAYEFSFTAHEGSRLDLIQMFGQSNDLFYAPDGINLFDSNGEPINGDITSHFKLRDAGTEVNQEPGFGPDQAPRQATANTGASEHKPVDAVSDGFTYPATQEVIRITISHQ